MLKKFRLPIIILVLAFSAITVLGGMWASFGSIIIHITKVPNNWTYMEYTITGEGTATCWNNGENYAPGQGVFTFENAGSQTNTEKVTGKNGYIELEFTMDRTWQEAGCPNDNWTVITEGTFNLDATIEAKGNFTYVDWDGCWYASNYEDYGYSSGDELPCLVENQWSTK